MDLFNPTMYNPYDIPPDMTQAEARDILTSHYESRLSIPYASAKQLYVIAGWDMNGCWIPISYAGLTLEQAVRKAQLKNIVYDQDLVYIVTPTPELIELTNILLKTNKYDNVSTDL